jgi:hypothetical protein
MELIRNINKKQLNLETKSVYIFQSNLIKLGVNDEHFFGDHRDVNF